MYYELWGFVTLLEVAWEAGIQKLLFESDSKVVVQFVTNGVSHMHPFWSTVEAIRSCR